MTATSVWVWQLGHPVRVCLHLPVLLTRAVLFVSVRVLAILAVLFKFLPGRLFSLVVLCTLQVALLKLVVPLKLSLLTTHLVVLARFGFALVSPRLGRVEPLRLSLDLVPVSVEVLVFLLASLMVLARCLVSLLALRLAKHPAVSCLPVQAVAVLVVLCH